MVDLLFVCIFFVVKIVNHSALHPIHVLPYHPILIILSFSFTGLMLGLCGATWAPVSSFFSYLISRRSVRQKNIQEELPGSVKTIQNIEEIQYTVTAYLKCKKTVLL